MNRNAVRGGIAVVATAVIACMLLLAAAALAAKPKKGAHFAGHTSATKVEGFRAPVTFGVSSNGRTLTNFTFGSFGCFGAGGFRPGVNPYTGNSLIKAGKLKVPASGHFSDKASSSYSIAGTGTSTTMTITGTFSTPMRVSGTITFRQIVFGGGPASSCGPAKVSFSATAK